MLGRVCNLTSYLEGNPRQFFKHLLGDPGGQTKLLSLINTTLSCVEHFSSDPSMKSSVNRANHYVKGIKVVFTFSKTPLCIPAINRQILKSKRILFKLCQKEEGKPHFDKGESLRQITTILGIARSVLTLLGDAIFKPLILIIQPSKLDGEVSRLAETWQYISVLKSGCKIGFLSGKLALHSKNPHLKLCELIIEICDLTLSSLELARINFPPLLSISLSVAKSTRDIYQIYLITA